MTAPSVALRMAFCRRSVLEPLLPMVVVHVAAATGGGSPARRPGAASASSRVRLRTRERRRDGARVRMEASALAGLVHVGQRIPRQTATAAIGLPADARRCDRTRPLLRAACGHQVGL